MFFWKRIIWKKINSADSRTDISAENRTGRRNKNKNTIPEADGNSSLPDTRCGRKALEKMRGKKENGKRWSKKRIALLSCIAVFVSLLTGTFLYIYDIWENPMEQFETVGEQFSEIRASETPIAVKTEEPVSDPTETPAESPTEDPYDCLVSEADLSILKDIVNIILIGVDYAEERETWNGKHAYHADVMIVLSINTVTGEVNLISLPRDTYAKIPGIDGIYKLNASIDCGGGWPMEGGFKKVCEAASWMLGGIPVQYYYAVDMSAVKGLVDSVGGVDFDIDIDFNIQGRSYGTGLQHMNGQAVLDYLRVRKNLGSVSGDLNRINRQKRMLVAIFEQIKSSGLLANLPGMLDAFSGNLYTNTTLAQTAGLAAFLYKIDSANIELSSMDGEFRSIFNWSFVITDQEKRVKLIKDVYGVDVPENKDYTYASASRLWEQMQAKVIKSKSKSILSKVKKMLDKDAEKPKPTEPAPDPTDEEPALTPEPAETPAETAAAAECIGQHEYNVVFGQSAILFKPEASGGYQKYDEQDWNLYYNALGICNRLLKIKSTSELRSANIKLKTYIEELCRRFDIAKPGWRVNYEKNSNEIYVDFN